jgi:hypothetical protein
MEFLLDLFMAGLCASTALAAVWGWRAAKNRQVKQALRNARGVHIGEYPNGARRRIVGELSLLDDALTAPLSGRRCAGYVVAVEHSRGDSTVAYEMKCVSFVIRDMTGRAIVHPEHVRVALATRDYSTSSWSESPTSREYALLRRLAAEDLEELMNFELRFREGVLEPGAFVAVLGHGVVSLDEAVDRVNEHHGGYREPAGQTKVTISGSSRASVLISDDPSVLLDPHAAA